MMLWAKIKGNLENFKINAKKAIKFDILRNWFWIVHTYIKWAILNVIVFIFNGFFIYCGVYLWQYPDPIVKMFAFGAALYFLAKIIRACASSLMTFKMILMKIPFKKDNISDWQKFKKNNLKKRGIQ